ncbi:hypothetical protein [Acinetobacter sp. MD2(2019)]|uniref:hypothetical protein n=1 Tax=Acinetobacter sp. MD2(2019) TaxID=2605273 RepID=UPI002D1F3A97|nr:hypothetical protein [Acinetobacter sp. MD2(2019)]MEB3753354.1 hypothetical protein [Acinetobacter sp. MD2(2019)]
MTPWEKLDLEPTIDQRQIRKAYAKQLKLIDQDTQPEAFIELREALAEAQHAAENNLYQTDNDENENNFEWLDSDTETEDIHHPDQLYSMTNAFDIDSLFENLKQHIQQQDIHFNIRAALAEFHQRLNELSNTDLKNLYQDKMEQLLLENDLDDFLTVLDDAKSTQDEIQNEQRSTPIDSFDPHNLPNDTEQTEYLALYQVLLHQTGKALWEDDISDETFILYEQLLALQFDLTLAEQIEIKDELTRVLSQLRIEAPSTQYFRFLKLWHQVYPEDAQEYNDSFYAQNLQERLNDYLHRYKDISQLSNEDYDNLQILSGNKPFAPIRTYQFNRKLKRQTPSLNLYETALQIGLTNTASNHNFQFIKCLNLNQKQHFLWINLVLLAGLYQILAVFIYPALNYSQIFTVCAIVTYFYAYIVQPIIHAEIVVLLNQQDDLKNYTMIWFFSGLILCGVTPLLNSDFNFTLTLIWLIFSIILFGCIQQNAKDDTNNVINENLQDEKWMIYAILAGICAAIGYLFYTLGLQSSPWLGLFSLMPIGCLLLPDTFRPSFLLFGNRRKETELTETQISWASSIIILLRTGMIYWIGSVIPPLLIESISRIS